MLKNSAIYLGGSLLTKAVPFALLPILTRHLSPEEYGMIALFQVAVSLATAVIGMNVKVNIGRVYYHVDAQGFRDNITAIFRIATISFVCVQTLFLLMVGLDLNPFAIPDQWLAAVPIISFMTILTGFQLTLDRVKQKAWRFLAFDVSRVAITGLLTVFLIVVIGLGWEGQATSFAVLSIFYGLFSWYSLGKEPGFSEKVDWQVVRENTRVSVPLFPHALATTVIVMSDRLFIEKLIGVDATGIYSVGYQFGAVSFIFSQAYMKAWSPWFYRQMKEPSDKIKQRIVRSTYVSLAGVLAVTVAYAYLAVMLAPYFIDESYYEAIDYITWVALSCVSYAVYQWFFPYLVLAKRTHFLAISSTVAMVTNLLLNYFLILEYGVIGAAYATFFSYLVSGLLVMLAAIRFVDMPWLSRR